jgi:hypothetical protein
MTTIPGATTQTVGGISLDTATLDPETMLLALSFERSQTLESVVKDQMSGMQEKNAQIRQLNEVAMAARSAPFPDPQDASDLANVGKQMSEWGSAGGRSWMNPDFKDVLDKYGIPHAASNMSKSAMSTSSGGWTVSYPTSQYHAMGREVMAKAEELKNPKLDLNSTIPNSTPPQTYAEAFKAAGIPLPKDANGNEITKLTQDQMKAMVQNVQSKIDSVSANSQLDMIRMQSMINKRNQAVEMLTNLVQKFAKTTDSVVSNMR